MWKNPIFQERKKNVKKPYFSGEKKNVKKPYFSGGEKKINFWSLFSVEKKTGVLKISSPEILSILILCKKKFLVVKY